MVAISKANAVASISHLTIRDGHICAAAGGVYNNGVLTISDSVLGGNMVAFGFGGGIHNAGALTINNSTLSDNTAEGGPGAGEGGSMLRLLLSTISVSSLSN